MMRESDPREADSPLDETRRAVHMMTAHSAKGLEFKVVFVAAMDVAINDSAAPFSFTPTYGLGASWIHPATGQAADDAFHRVNKEEIARREEEEAHRLLYVALTRAEEHLVLSYSDKRKWARLVERVFPEAGDVVIQTPFGKTFKARVMRTSSAPARDQLALDFEGPRQSPELARPSIDGQHDSAVNVTSLTLFHECPRKYYLARYLGFEEGRRRRLEDFEDIEEREDTRLSASDLGLQVHALLAGQVVPDADPQAVRLAGVFTRSELGQRAARAGHVEREFAFLLAIEDIAVSGTIDLWFEEGGEMVLVDYKTGAGDDAEEYALQLQIYALTLERVTGRLPDRAYLHFLRTDKVIPVAIDAGAAVRAVRELALAQNTLHFPLKEGAHCNRCQFVQGLCPAARWRE
jgi:ATP-dependent exoDNAse (exonuclease V) beta subunit